MRTGVRDWLQIRRKHPARYPPHHCTSRLARGGGWGHNGAVLTTDERLALVAAQAEASPDGLLVVSADGRMAVWNTRFAEIWGFPAELLDVQDDAGALKVAMSRVVDPEEFLRRVQEVYADPVRPVQDEIELNDGRILDRYGAPLHTQTGEYLGWSWYFRDVTFHRRNERDLRELARTLQASLLPPLPPEIPGMEVATHYLPADHHVGVGGDFYDVFRIAPNQWGVCIGDVCGKGAKAASLTTLARYATRAAAVHAPLPSSVLAELNSVITAEPEADGRFCSVVYGSVELDSCGAWVTLSCGGHPRPIVVRRAGWIDVRGQAGTLIGLFDDAIVEDDRVGLGPGDALVFCTDGITEARDAAGEMFGDERLASVLLEHAGQTATAMASAVLDAALAFSGGRRHDDVALLVLRVPEDDRSRSDDLDQLQAAIQPGRSSAPAVGDEYAGLRQQRPAPPREARIKLTVDARSGRDARLFILGVLRSWRMTELLDGDIELLVSELASNAVRHARSDFTVVARYDGEAVKVEIGDGSRIIPKPVPPTPDQTEGRGLFLVNALADDWGIVPTLDGKRIWFEMAVTSPEAN